MVLPVTFCASEPKTTKSGSKLGMTSSKIALSGVPSDKIGLTLVKPNVYRPFWQEIDYQKY